MALVWQSVLALDDQVQPLSCCHRVPLEHLCLVVMDPAARLPGRWLFLLFTWWLRKSVDDWMKKKKPSILTRAALICAHTDIIPQEGNYMWLLGPQASEPWPTADTLTAFMKVDVLLGVRVMDLVLTFYRRNDAQMGRLAVSPHHLFIWRVLKLRQATCRWFSSLVQNCTVLHNVCMLSVNRVKPAAF